MQQIQQLSRAGQVSQGSVAAQRSLVRSGVGGCRVRAEVWSHGGTSGELF